jgi:hypothetical protein
MPRVRRGTGALLLRRLLPAESRAQSVPLVLGDLSRHVAMVLDLVLADFRDIGRDVPSRPAPVVGTRQGATEQQLQQQQAWRDARERAQRTKLDLRRA